MTGTVAVHVICALMRAGLLNCLCRSAASVALLPCLAGMGACVSLNIMWLHAEQASFKMTREQYQDKLDSVAQLVNVLGQTDKVCVAQRSSSSKCSLLLPATGGHRRSCSSLSKCW